MDKAQIKQMAKAYERKLRNEILDKAIIIDFPYIDELSAEISRHSFLYAKDKSSYLLGFSVMLTELQRDSSLQGKTLFDTLLNVKAALWLRYKHKSNSKPLNQITLTVRHMELNYKHG
jgi:hypothetical protein